MMPSSALNVCHIISGDLWAGAEVMACHLLKSLAEIPGIQPRVVLLNHGRLADELQQSGIKVEVYDESKHSFRQIATSLQTCLCRDGAKIVHSHRYKENLLAYWSTRSVGGIKRIATQHGLPESLSMQWSPKKQVITTLNQYVLRRHFDKTVAVSQSIYDFFISEYGVSTEKITVINNGVVSSVSNDERQSDKGVVVGSAGRLFPVKDFPLMVACARHVFRKCDDFSFVLAGEGPERANIARGIEGDGSLSEAFLLRGHLDDISAFYGSIDIYINTSLHEGIPMSILEAMAHGIPVVAPAVGGISEIIEDGVDGFLVKERTPEAFARPIFQLRDPNERRRIGTAAREKICRSFSEQRMAEQYCRLYRSLVKSH